jgi:hypothetical protein
VRSGSDLSVDAQDAEGVLTSDRITETDILDGRWDNAEVEVWRVNWADTGPARADAARRHRPDPARAARLRRRGPLARPCAGPDGRADLPGDLRRRAWRCALRRRSGGPGLQGHRRRDRSPARPAFTASGLGGFEAGWFTFGTIEWTSGANAGRRTEVLGHDVTDGIAC